MHGLRRIPWKRARILIGAAAAVAALAVSAAPTSAATQRAVRYGHKIGAERSELFGRKIGSDRAEGGGVRYGHKIGAQRIGRTLVGHPRSHGQPT